MKRPVVIVLLVALVAIAVVTLRGGAEPYTVSMKLENAGGLDSGSPVAIGGVAIGKVELEPSQNDVVAKLLIEDKYAPLDRDVKATILARNALGQKQVVLAPREGALQPAPDGYRIPRANVETASDLDQLLKTLDPDMRSRLAVLLNEAGLAFDGRKIDFRMLVDDLGPALGSGTDLLGQVTKDNAALGNVLETSDRFIATMARQRGRFVRTVDLLGRTTENVATRRAELQATLRSAPAALDSTRSFLAELRRTTTPLGVTARQLTAVAPPLLAVIDGIEPFRAAAAPTLDAATDAAPSLLGLTGRTSRSLRGALPALDSVKALAQQEIPGVKTALDTSMDNLLATVDNWSHAIQFRDGLSHVFRGESAFAPSFIEPPKTSGARRSPKRGANSEAKDRPPTSSPSRDPSRRSPVLPKGLTDLADKVPAVKKATEALQGLLGGATGPKAEQPPAGDSPSSDLLDFLMGN